MHPRPMAETSGPFFRAGGLSCRAILAPSSRARELYTCRIMKKLLLVVSILVGLAPVAAAEVVRVEIARRADVGASGYEKLVGTIYFAVDPAHPRNAVVVDLDKARKTARGSSSSLPTFTSCSRKTRPGATASRWSKYRIAATKVCSRDSPARQAAVSTRRRRVTSATGS